MSPYRIDRYCGGWAVMEATLGGWEPVEMFADHDDAKRLWWKLLHKRAGKGTPIPAAWRDAHSSPARSSTSHSSAP